MCSTNTHSTHIRIYIYTLTQIQFKQLYRTISSLEYKNLLKNIHLMDSFYNNNNNTEFQLWPRHIWKHQINMTF